MAELVAGDVAVGEDAAARLQFISPAVGEHTSRDRETDLECSAFPQISNTEPKVGTECSFEISKLQ